MTSILTNSGAIVALQTLKMTNKNLSMTQNHISTGRYINKASDGAATWAIAKTMETDRDSFSTISRGLNNAATVVGVAEEKASGIKEDLNSIKQLLLQASNPDNDVTLNWKEVEQWINNIESKINQAQFNGVNLLNKDGTGNGDGQPYRVVGSLDRAYGETTTRQTAIEVASSDLKTQVLDVLKQWTEPTNAREAQQFLSGAGTPTTHADFGRDIAEYLGTAAVAAVADDATTANIDESRPAVAAIPAATGDRKAELEAKYTVGSVTGANVLVTANRSANEAAYEALYTTANTGLTASENSIESLIKIAIDETARLGSAKSRIESQTKSVDLLKDALTQGIGVLVDADLEESSARLQALQAQQQLGIQALSMANQAPQSVLSLFR